MDTQQITRVLEGCSSLGKKTAIASLDWKLNRNQGILAKQFGLSVVE